MDNFENMLNERNATKGYVLYVSICKKCLEKGNPKRQKLN